MEQYVKTDLNASNIHTRKGNLSVIVSRQVRIFFLLDCIVNTGLPIIVVSWGIKIPHFVPMGVHVENQWGGMKSMWLVSASLDMWVIIVNLLRGVNQVIGS